MNLQLKQGENFCVIIGSNFPNVASFMTTYQRVGASKYVNTLAYSKSGYPNSGLSFAVLGAAIVTHVRWKSPAIRDELMVGRTVNVVNFDVVPLL